MMIELILLVIFVLLSGFFSGSEIAIMSVRESRIAYLVKKGVSNAFLLQELREKKERTLIAILIGNNIVNIAASSLATVIAIGFFGNLGVGIATGIMTFLLLVFGEITPKAYCANNAESIALAVSPFIFWLSIILSPLIWFFMLLLKLLSPWLKQESLRKSIDEGEILSIVEQSEKIGSIQRYEREMINNVFMFDDLVVGDIMVPKARVFALDANATVASSLPLIKEKGYSRIPLYEKNKHMPLGVLYVKDLFLVDPQQPLRAYAHEPLVFTKEKKIVHAFKEMREQCKHLALVTDGHGKYVGIISIEDIIEVIVGEIYDETDKLL
ncbi:MAG: hemolysin family protein [Candidatus Woesearchaeota archaeon]